MAAPAFERVSPSTSVDRRTLRPIALVALGLALACVVAVVLSGPQHQSPYALQEGAMMPDPAEAVASAAETVSSVAPFHDASDDPLVKLGSEDEEIPRQVMEPRWAMREGSEAAAHALSQPFTVPLVKDGKEVPGDIAPLGEYAPLTPVYNNPLAQFIPNVTWHANGDVVYGWDGKPADEATLRAIEDEEAKKEAAMDQERLEIAREQEAAGEIKNEIAQEGKPSLDEAVAAKEAEIEQTEKDLAAIEKPSVSEPATLNGPGDSSKEMARLYAVLSSREKELAEKTAAATAVKEKIAALQATQGMVPGVVPEGKIVNQPQGPAAAPAVDVAGGWVSPVFKPSAQAQAGAVAGAVAAAKQSLPYGVAVGAPNPSGYILKPFFQLPAQ